jgi:hypothetical protein
MEESAQRYDDVGRAAHPHHGHDGAFLLEP